LAAKFYLDGKNLAAPPNFLDTWHLHRRLRAVSHQNQFLCLPAALFTEDSNLPAKVS
jgi:hypothetical protein